MDREARWWRLLPDGRVQCELCPRHCALREGQRGFCFVRRAAGGRIVATTYGRSMGLCLDPIEKKPLNHFLPGSSVLSFGTAGCNLGCRYCQNWDMTKSRRAELTCVRASPEAVADAALATGARSVAFTYNDPVIWAEYAIDTAIACHEKGVKTVAVTAGYITSAARADFFAHTDAANVDLKAFSEAFYERLCLGHLAPVLDTLIYVRRETGVWLEVTTLLIPGENDSEDETARLAAWMARELGEDVPLHLTAFHPDYRMLSTSATPMATLRRARQIAKAEGLRHVYTGNVRDLGGSTTYCANCREPLIVRDGYSIVHWSLRGAECSGCGETLPGVFDAAPQAAGCRRSHGAG